MYVRVIGYHIIKFKITAHAFQYYDIKNNSESYKIKMFLLHFKYMQFVIADQSIDAWLYFCEM